MYQFGFGQSPFPVPEKIVEALKNNAHRKEYLPIQGLPELRESISNYLLKKTGIKYPKEHILITPGSKEAMLLMHVAFKGEILLPAPSWVSYEPQAQIGLNKVHWLKTSRENNWFPTAKEIEICKEIIDRVAQQVMQDSGQKIEYLVGTMIELPRAALKADELAGPA